MIQLRQFKMTLAVLAALWVVLGLTGCAAQYTDYSAFIREPKPLVTSSSYIIAPPDRINMESKRVREINNQSRIVSPDGKINLPLIGEVMAAGKTPVELSDELSDIAQQYYEDAKITVWVAGYNSKKIFVFGEVTAPGKYAYFGANTVLGTMAMAQPTRLADPSKVQVLRPSPDGQLRKRMTIDLNEMVKKGDTTLDAVLEEGDILYVPPNPLAAVGLALQQVLLPLQPLSATVRNPANIYDNAQSEAYGGNRSTTVGGP